MGDLVGWSRTREEIPLRVIATELAGGGELSGGLDALGDGDQAQGVGEAGDVGRDRRALLLSCSTP